MPRAGREQFGSFLNKKLRESKWEEAQKQPDKCAQIKKWSRRDGAVSPR